MVSQIQYGGRITDDFDKLLMDTYAERYFTPAAVQVCLVGFLNVVVCFCVSSF